MRASELFTKITNQNGLFNIQSIDNIPSIIKYGILSNEKASQIQHTSIAMPEIQERREHLIIPNGMLLHKYANVYFDPKNPMLYKRKNENENICILKIDREILDQKGVVVSDRNASSAYASFYPPLIGLQMINFQLVYAPDWRDENIYEYYKKKSIKCAEVLIPYSIPFDFIVGAAVYSIESKQKLNNIGFNKTVFVDPQFFF